MDNRKYNVYFHTHTISGIIICVLLYVIFFAGSFAFFRDDLSAWQKNKSHLAEQKVIHRDFQSAIDTLGLKHTMKGRDLDFFVQKSGSGAYVSMSASHDTTIKKQPGKKKSDAKHKGRGRRGRGDEDTDYLSYDFEKKCAVDYSEGYDIGEFLYRLHFFAQLNAVPLRLGTPFGYLLAGIVSFLFLFALITGLMLHWDKIVTNFFTFRPWNKWKTVWTDMHTALGVIGFPFQFIYAVTGTVLIANFFLLAPFTKYLYGGNTEKIYHDLEYSDTTKYEYTYQPLKAKFNMNSFVEKIEHKWPGSTINKLQVKNYNDANMHLIIEGKPNANASFAGTGKVVYRIRDNKLLYESSPEKSASYVDKVRSTIYHLHFGDFGGRPLRVIYFVLGAMVCLVLISGILIWLVARDKNTIATKKRAFNLWIANVFMASCLSMLPVTAFTMICLMFIGKPTQDDIYHLYFYSWFVLSVYFIVRNRLVITNRQALVISSILCLVLPLVDGIRRGNWFWVTFKSGALDILFVDVLFFCLALICIVSLIKMQKHQAKLAAVNNKS